MSALSDGLSHESQHDDGETTDFDHVFTDGLFHCHGGIGLRRVNHRVGAKVETPNRVDGFTHHSFPVVVSHVRKRETKHERETQDGTGGDVRARIKGQRALIGHRDVVPAPVNFHRVRHDGDGGAEYDLHDERRKHRFVHVEYARDEGPSRTQRQRAASRHLFKIFFKRRALLEMHRRPRKQSLHALLHFLHPRRASMNVFFRLHLVHQFHPRIVMPAERERETADALVPRIHRGADGAQLVMRRAPTERLHHSRRRLRDAVESERDEHRG